MKTTDERRAEFNRIAAQAAAGVKKLREEEAKRLLAIEAERIRQRLELEREAADQGVELPPQDELAARRKKIGEWPKPPAA